MPFYICFCQRNGTRSNLTIYTEIVRKLMKPVFVGTIDEGGGFLRSFDRLNRFEQIVGNSWRNFTTFFFSTQLMFEEKPANKYSSGHQNNIAQ